MNILFRPYYNIQIPGSELLIEISIINYLNYRMLLYLGLLFLPVSKPIIYNVRKE